VVHDHETPVEYNILDYVKINWRWVLYGSADGIPKEIYKNEFVINEKLQGRVATRLRCGGLFNITLLKINFWMW